MAITLMRLIASKQLIEKGFVRFIRQNLDNVKLSLPGALCKAGEANYE